MMRPIIATLLLFLSFSASAQSVDIKGVESGEEETTRIEIRKGKNLDQTSPAGAKWAITEGEADIEGEADAMTKEAKAKWRKACDDWKKEFRADNKDNQILNLNCGSATCSGAAGGKTCTSKASYKIKTRVD